MSKLNSEKIKKIIDTDSSNNTARVKAPKSSSQIPSRAAIYFHDTQMGNVVHEICKQHSITQQEFYWYALNLAIQEYGYDEIERPADRRLKTPSQ